MRTIASVQLDKRRPALILTRPSKLHLLTWVTVAYDPVYLTEPMIRSSEYRLQLPMQIPPYPCTVVEEVDRPAGMVPSYMPGENPFLKEFGEKYNIPLEMTLGGAASMYPEAQRKVTADINAAAKRGAK